MRSFSARAASLLRPVLRVAGLILAALFGVDSAQGAWVPLGPFGADGWYVLSVAIDPTSPSTVFAGTRGLDGICGVFKTSNGGLTWNVVKLLHDPTLNAQPGVPALAIDPVSPSTVYAAVNGLGIAKTTDGGGTWVWMNDGLSSLSIYSLVLDPVAPSTLYAATGDGIFKTTDGAAQWLTYDSARFRAICLAIDPSNTSTIYAGSVTGVYKSGDGGQRWTLLNGGLAPTWVSTIAVDPVTPATVYVGTNGEYPYVGLYKTTNGGASWAAANNGLTGYDLYAIVVDARPPSTIYACTNAGVVRSTDGGQSWRLLALRSVFALAIDQSLSATFFAASGTVLRSNDGGVTWTAPTDGFFPIEVFAVAAGIRTAHVYAATNLKGILTSEDGGRSWTRSGARIPSVTALIVDPFSDVVVYASNADGVFKSSDGAMNWSRAGLDGLPVTSLALDPLAPGTLYAGTAKGALFESANGGTSWVQIGSLPGSASSDRVTALAVDPSKRTIIYAGTQSGSDDLRGAVYRSTDGGVSWTSAARSVTESVTSLVVDPNSASTVFAGTAGFYGVFRSLDGGQNWSPLSIFGPCRALGIDAGSPSALYVVYGLVARTTDGSKIVPLNDGLTYTYPHAIAVVASLSTVYLGTQVGIFRADLPRALEPQVPLRRTTPRRSIPPR